MRCSFGHRKAKWLIFEGNVIHYSQVTIFSITAALFLLLHLMTIRSIDGHSIFLTNYNNNNNISTKVQITKPRKFEYGRVSELKEAQKILVNNNKTTLTHRPKTRLYTYPKRFLRWNNLCGCANSRGLTLSAEWMNEWRALRPDIE